ncbi:alpha/beta hydrolase [Fusarium oxysporum f. sp. phaseoli]
MVSDTLSFFGKLGLAVGILLAVKDLVIILIRGLPLAIRRRIPLRLWFASLVGRTLLGSFSPNQIQYLTTPTLEVYETWVKKQRAELVQQAPQGPLNLLNLDIENLGDTGASVMWIGDRMEASKIVLFFHGGGYISPPLPGHFTWCWEAYVNASLGAKAQVAVAVLQYTLSPRAQYPDQLHQASSALNHLLQSGVNPRDLIFGGDSAGGNMSVQLLYHILHPHPNIPPVKLVQPVAGIFLVSPWLSYRTDTASFKENNNVDMLSSGLIQQTSHHAVRRDDLAPKSSEAHPVCAMDGDLSWLEHVHDVTDALYVTAGRQEVFRDAIVGFAEAVRRRCPSVSVDLEVSDHEAHDYILLENDAGIIGDATQRMRRWASGRLATYESL